MFVVKDKKALVVPTKEPDQLTTLISSAKHIRVKNKDLVIMPHNIDEVKVLRNMGIDAPSPIKYYYPWPGRNAPFIAQRETAAFLTLNRRAFVLNSLGTGKTLATLWAYHYLKMRGKVGRLLIVSPLSTLERTWADEIFKNFPELTFAVLHGDAKRRKRLLATDHDVYIINHDGLDIIKKELDTRPDIDIVVVDEIAQCARNVQTRRWKALNATINGPIQRQAWGLTATPTPNEPTDAWGQVKLLNFDSIKHVPYFKRFRDITMKQKGPFTWVPRDTAMETVKSIMQPSIRFTRDECIDLPPCMYEARHIPLTPEQHTAYKDMQNKLRSESEQGEILAVNEAVKLSKLVQIACGVAYDTEGGEVSIGSQPRLEAVNEIIETSDAKVIVFVPFRSSIDLVQKYLEGTGKKVGVIHGGVPSHQRGEIFREFQNDNSEMRVLLAQPAAMSHGLTLTAANTIVWYAPVCSNEIFEQANGRITRPGQKNNQFIIMIEGTPVERRIYERLKSKQKLQGTLLDMVQDDFSE